MRITILPNDKSVAINGEGYNNLDLSFIDATVHAVQWYDTYGEIEYKDPITQKMTRNEKITSFKQFESVIAIWQAEKNKNLAEITATEITATEI